MQTFLPYADFIESAKSLDYRRLGKQRVEVKQILNALDGKSKGWTNHPATNMWRGYETALALYGVAICNEWIQRGYKDSLLPEFTERVTSHELSKRVRAGRVPLVEPMTIKYELPPIIGDSRLHLSHKSNLLRKDPIYYTPIFGEEIPHDLPYFWG